MSTKKTISIKILSYDKFCLHQDLEDQDIDRTMWGELESESEEESEEGYYKSFQNSFYLLFIYILII